MQPRCNDISLWCCPPPAAAHEVVGKFSRRRMAPAALGPPLPKVNHSTAMSHYFRRFSLPPPAIDIGKSHAASPSRLTRADENIPRATILPQNAQSQVWRLQDAWLDRCCCCYCRCCGTCEMRYGAENNSLLVSSSFTRAPQLSLRLVLTVRGLCCSSLLPRGYDSKTSHLPRSDAAPQQHPTS
jgi:hypothetical protein